MNDKLFVAELLRNHLYTDTAYIIIVISNLTILLAVFGCFAAAKEVKCLLLTYAVFMLLLLVILAVGGVLAYIFRDQVRDKKQGFRIQDSGIEGKILKILQRSLVHFEQISLGVNVHLFHHRKSNRKNI